MLHAIGTTYTPSGHDWEIGGPDLLATDSEFFGTLRGWVDFTNSARGKTQESLLPLKLNGSESPIHSSNTKETKESTNRAPLRMPEIHKRRKMQPWLTTTNPDESPRPRKQKACIGVSTSILLRQREAKINRKKKLLRLLRRSKPHFLTTQSAGRRKEIKIKAATSGHPRAWTPNGGDTGRFLDNRRLVYMHREPIAAPQGTHPYLMRKKKREASKLSAARKIQAEIVASSIEENASVDFETGANTVHDSKEQNHNKKSRRKMNKKSEEATNAKKIARQRKADAERALQKQRIEEQAKRRQRIFQARNAKNASVSDTAASDLSDTHEVKNRK